MATRPTNKGSEYQVHMGEVVAWLIERATETGPTSVAQDDDAGRYDANDELAKLRREQRIGQALKNSIAQGELIPAQDVVEGWQAAIGRARSLLLGLPPACADEVCILSSKGPTAVREYLADRMHDALVELTNTKVDDDDDEEPGPEDGPEDGLEHLGAAAAH